MQLLCDLITNSTPDLVVSPALLFTRHKCPSAR